ncbi:MAG: alpha/beta hydrolase, partial [Ilumatobacteraceae bacterium]
MTPASSAFVERFPVLDGSVGHVRVADDVSLRMIERRPAETDPSLPTIILVHGLASNARMWDGVARELSTQNVRTIAVDLRGHGRSDRP